jgi:hypothetical protein
VVSIKLVLIWVLAPRRFVGQCQRFGETFCPDLQAEVTKLGSGGLI